MAALYVIIAVLVGAVIILFIQSRQRPRDLEKEIVRLRKAIASEGLNFEQVEYRIASLKDDIAVKRKMVDKGKMKSGDIVKYLEKMEKELDSILEELLSGKSMK
jgi:hypothetical protein